MDQPDLRALLEQLHHELVTNPPADDRSRALLLGLQRDIEHVITASGDPANPVIPSADPPNLRARVQETIAGFEGAHPESAGALERVLVLLSNFGL